MTKTIKKTKADLPFPALLEIAHVAHVSVHQWPTIHHVGLLRKAFRVAQRNGPLWLHKTCADILFQPLQQVYHGCLAFITHFLQGERMKGESRPVLSLWDWPSFFLRLPTNLWAGSSSCTSLLCMSTTTNTQWQLDKLATNTAVDCSDIREARVALNRCSLRSTLVRFHRPYE